MMYVLFILSVAAILYSMILNFVIIFSYGRKIKELENKVECNVDLEKLKDTTDSEKIKLNTGKILFSDLFNPLKRNSKETKNNGNTNTDSYMNSYTPAKDKKFMETQNNEFKVKYERKTK